MPGLDDIARAEGWPLGTLEAVRVANTLCLGWGFWWSPGDAQGEAGRGYYAVNPAKHQLLYHPNIHILIVEIHRRERP